MSIEYEVKLRGSRHELTAALRATGAVPAGERTLEDDILLDTRARELSTSGRVLRLRCRGERFLLTLKGPRVEGVGVKARPEVQTRVADGAATLELLRGLGFDIVLRYQKYRTFYRGEGGRCAGLAVSLDETPVGTFIEVEGDPHGIDACAADLGFARADYETRSYLEIFRDQGGSGDMLLAGMDGAAWPAGSGVSGPSTDDDSAA